MGNNNGPNVISDVDRIVKLEQELKEYAGKDRIISSFEVQEKLKNDKTPIIRYLSKINKLDALTEGFAPGEVIVVSGRTKCGKTSWCQTLTWHYAEQHIPSLWFTYEIPVRQFFKKFPGGQDVPLFFLPMALSGSSLEWIERRIIESKLKHDVKIVFIDHLHYLVPMSTQNMSILIGHTMRELKKMAIRHNILIFLIAHTSKAKGDATKDKNDKPGLEELRDSSFVGQESDFVLMISRPYYDEDDPDVNADKSATLQVLANRWNGLRGSVHMIYENHTFKEVMDNR